MKILVSGHGRRPKRTVVNRESLNIVGIPYQFQDKTLEDFKDFGHKPLKEVKQYVRDYIDNLNLHSPGIFFYGSNGVGKTFLSSLILKQAYVCRLSCKRVTWLQYIDQYTRVWSAKSAQDKEMLEDNLYNNYKAVEVLVIEEIGKEVDSKISAPILEDLLRYREDRGLTTIICSNLAPVTLEERYGASVMSLLQGNLTPIKIVGDDLRKES